MGSIGKRFQVTGKSNSQRVSLRRLLICPQRFTRANFRAVPGYEIVLPHAVDLLRRVNSVAEQYIGRGIGRGELEDPLSLLQSIHEFLSAGYGVLRCGIRLLLVEVGADAGGQQIEIRI